MRHFIGHADQTLRAEVPFPAEVLPDRFSLRLFFTQGHYAVTLGKDRHRGGARSRRAEAALRLTDFPKIALGQGFRSGDLRPYLEYDVVFAGVFDHFQSKIVFRPNFSCSRMFNLEGFNLLGEIGGMSADVDYIVNAQRSAWFEPHRNDREVAIIVCHDANTLFVARGRPNRFRGSFTD